jgi:putative transposase
MTYDSQKYPRRSLRLTAYDYSQAGAYFITACAQDRECLFGEVVDGQMHLNDAGRMVLAEWNLLPVRFPAVELDEFGIMPNHIHAIITISTVTGGADQAIVGRKPTASTFERTTELTGPVGATLVVALPDDPVPGPPPPILGDIVGALKSKTTDLYIHAVKHSGWPPFRGRLWQRNYHEHVIRSERSLNRIRQYILDNPANWASDLEHPDAERPKKKTA